jgi:phosphoglycerate dehydrogenase-like enzyme
MTAVGSHVVDRASQAHDGEERGPGLPIVGVTDSAGLDVFETESAAPESPVLQTPNMLFAPPCAGYSDWSAWRLNARTVADVVEWLRTGRLLHSSVVVAGTH